MSNNKSSVEWLLEQITYDNGYGQRRASFTETEDLTPYFEQAKEMEIAGKEMSYAEGYAEGYKRALELIEWNITTELKRTNVHESVNEQK